MAAAAYNNSFLLSNTRNKTNTSISLTRRRYYSPSSSSCRSPSSFVSHPSSNSKKSITLTSTSSHSFRLRVLTPEEEGSQTQIQPETATAGGGGDFGGITGGGGGGGRGDEEEDSSSDKNKKKMSMSQKLTLGYAALVGVGGVMGYVKGGSQKSLAAGGLSSLLLYYVYTQLPARPAFASSLGFGLSAALLVVMGSRFKKSGKLFPAGLVSFVSLVMTGGYFHGIMRGMH